MFSDLIGFGSCIDNTFICRISTVFPGYEARANDNAMFICRKLVTDMIYESRVSQNMVWKAQRHEKVRKSDMRNLRLTPEQYMEV
jgi:hypothetical protein